MRNPIHGNQKIHFFGYQDPDEKGCSLQKEKEHGSKEHKGEGQRVGKRGTEKKKAAAYCKIQ